MICHPQAGQEGERRRDKLRFNVQECGISGAGRAEAKGLGEPMRLGTTILAALIGTGILVTGASAEEIPATDVGFDWAGPYLGVYGGGADSVIFRGVRLSAPNAELGGQAGYNLVFGNLVVGAEGQIGASFYDCFPCGVPQWRLTGRLGFLAGYRALIYAEGGVVGTFPGVSWIVGGGTEIAIGDSWSMFGEALKSEFTWTFLVGLNRHLGN